MNYILKTYPGKTDLLSENGEKISEFEGYTAKQVTAYLTAKITNVHIIRTERGVA